jgi:Thioredoxin like C-terminal domain
VKLDGAAPGENCGLDTVPDGSGEIREPRLYQLIRQTGPIVDRTFEIEFLDPGVQALDFTFGWRLRGINLSANQIDHKGDKDMTQLRRQP